MRYDVAMQGADIEHPAATTRPAVELRAALVTLLLAAPPTAVCLLLARRFSGALSHPLPPAALIASGLVLAAWAAVARKSLQTSNISSRFGPLPVLLLASAALWVPGTSPAAGAIFLLILIAAEAAGVAGWRLSFAPNALRIARRQPDPKGRSRASDTTSLDASNPGEQPVPDDVLEHFVRRREPQGGESVSGWLRVGIMPGQRTAAAHVAFCPPLARIPQCAAEQIAGPAAEIRVAQVLAFGVRFELKLDCEALEADNVLLEFSAFEQP